MDNFCEAIRRGEVQKETARGFMAAVRKILGKLRGKGIKQFDAVTKQLAEKAAKQFGTELKTAENAVKAMQQVLSEAVKAEKNTTQEGDVLPSKKNKHTKTTAVRHADSVRHAEHGAIRMTSKSVTGSANNLGISVSLSQTSDSVKRAIVLFSDIADAIDSGSTVFGSKKPISANNLQGILVANGVLNRGGASNSAYAQFGNLTLRISDHSANASNFETTGENLSISLMNAGKSNDFVKDDGVRVIEAKFRKGYLNKQYINSRYR